MDTLHIWWGADKHFSTSYDCEWNVLEGIIKGKDKEFWILNNEDTDKWTKEKFPEVGIYTGSVVLEEDETVWAWRMKFSVEVVKIPSIGTVLKCKRIGKILNVIVIEDNSSSQK